MIHISYSWLYFPLVVGLSSCVLEGGTDDLPPVDESFPEVLLSGPVQSVTVTPCFTIDLPDDMVQIDVQGFDSNVARFDSETLRVTSDCGAYDVSYDSAPVAQQNVVMEGISGVLSEYVGTYDLGEEIFSHVVVLHLKRPSEFNDFEHIDIGVFSQGSEGDAASLAILASVQDIWP